jgi:hypothetical protein
MKKAILEVPPELFIERMGFPADVKVIRARSFVKDSLGAYIEVEIESSSLPEPHPVLGNQVRAIYENGKFSKFQRMYE